jgi:hypothetical protein
VTILYEYCSKVYPERFFDILYKNDKIFDKGDPIISQVDAYLKADSVLIIERAFQHLITSCNTPHIFSSLVRSQCVEPIIKDIMNKGGENVVKYFDGGGTRRTLSKKAPGRRHIRTRIRH